MSRPPSSSERIIHGTMLAWCSISVRSTASPARRLARPQEWATRLSDSVVFLVKTISRAGSGAPTNRPATTPRPLVERGGLLGGGVDAAVHVGVRRLVVARHGVDDGLGLQGGGGGVEIHDRPAVHRARQQGEVLAQRLDVQRRRRAPVGAGVIATPRNPRPRPAGQLGAAARHDAAVDEDVHDVGHELVEQALVVGDGEHAELGTRLAHGVHAAPDDAQGVDVEARVGLVEHGHERLEQRHLQDLVALLLAPGEALVEMAAGEGGVHPEALHPLGHEHAYLEDRHLGVLPRRHGLAQELGHRHALDRLGVLEGEKEPGLGARRRWASPSRPPR